jgi:hypothetical protein
MALNINGTTGISGVDGSVSAPAVTGTDSNTGITFPAADTIKFSTGGVERFAISNSGLSGDGSGLTGISAGITMADMWARTSSEIFGGGTYVLDNYWTRQTGIYEGIGSAMTQPSTGQFQFPSTGKYLIMVSCQFYTSANQDYIGVYIRHSTDSGSNYTAIANGFDSCSSGGTNYVRVMVNTFLDVTAPSTQRIALQGFFQNGLTLAYDPGQSTIIFIRLGDT